LGRTRDDLCSKGLAWVISVPVRKHSVVLAAALDCKTASVGMRSRTLSVIAAGRAADAYFARRSDFSRGSGGGGYLLV